HAGAADAASSFPVASPRSPVFAVRRVSLFGLSADLPLEDAPPAIHRAGGRALADPGAYLHRYGEMDAQARDDLAAKVPDGARPRPALALPTGSSGRVRSERGELGDRGGPPRRALRLHPLLPSLRDPRAALHAIGGPRSLRGDRLPRRIHRYRHASSFARRRPAARPSFGVSRSLSRSFGRGIRRGGPTRRRPALDREPMCSGRRASLVARSS